jgi:hypothetical protein
MTERGGRADGDRVADLLFLSRYTVHVPDDTVGWFGWWKSRLVSADSIVFCERE